MCAHQRATLEQIPARSPNARMRRVVLISVADSDQELDGFMGVSQRQGPRRSAAQNRFALLFRAREQADQECETRVASVARSQTTTQRGSFELLRMSKPSFETLVKPRPHGKLQPDKQSKCERRETGWKPTRRTGLLTCRCAHSRGSRSSQVSC